MWTRHIQSRGADTHLIRGEGEHATQASRQGDVQARHQRAHGCETLSRGDAVRTQQAVEVVDAGGAEGGSAAQDGARARWAGHRLAFECRSIDDEQQLYDGMLDLRMAVLGSLNDGDAPPRARSGSACRLHRPQGSPDVCSHPPPGSPATKGGPCRL